jgi:hypothetical protein
MASLGTFAAAKREYAPAESEPDTFEFCGETFTVKGTIPGMVHLTVAAAFSGKVTGVDFAAALLEAIQHALTAPAAGDTAEDESEWLRFYELAVAKSVPTEELRDIAYVLVGADTGRPTVRRSGSSTGSSATSTSSNSSSSDSPASPSSSPDDPGSAG